MQILFKQRFDLPLSTEQWLDRFSALGSGVIYECFIKGRCDGFRYLSFISSSLNAAVGVFHPEHFLSVPFKRSQIDFISRFVSVATGTSRGRKQRVRLIKFSTEPLGTESADHRTTPQFRFQASAYANS